MDQVKSRRKFIGSLAATASLAGLSGPVMAGAPKPKPSALMSEADEWFKNIKGTHRIVYDAPEPHNGFPIIWSWAYYYTNNQTGTTDGDMTSMVVLRHNAIPYALKDELWAKYNLGEVFNVDDPKTSSKAKRNSVYAPGEGDFPLPAIEGIKGQMERGAMFCVCELAIAVYSGAVAGGLGLDAEAVKKEWIAGVHPGIQVVPSGVWALGRAQEHGCGYIYAGG
jgi:hypothetical protein